MAVHGKKTRFWLATAADHDTLVDVSTYFNEVGFPRSKDEIDTTTFGSEDKTYEPGYKDKQFNTNGIQDSAGAIDAQLDGLYNIDDDVAAEYWPNGRPTGGTATPSQPAYRARIKIMSYDTTSTTSDVNKFSSTMRIEGAVTRAVS